VRFLPGLMFYPTAGESTEHFRERIEPAARELSRRWPDDCGAYFAAYRQWTGVGYTLGAQQVIDCAEAAYDAARTQRLRWLVGYIWRKPVIGPAIYDGVLMFPELLTFAQRIKAAVKTRNQFPKQKTAVPVPQKQPTMPTPTGPTHAQLELPTYGEFLDEIRANTTAIVERWQRPPVDAEVFRDSYRRLSEGWTHDQILKDIRGEQQRRVRGRQRHPAGRYRPRPQRVAATRRAVFAAEVAFWTARQPSRRNPRDTSHRSEARARQWRCATRLQRQLLQPARQQGPRGLHAGTDWRSG
jgi:hypothetical protein